MPSPGAERDAATRESSSRTAEVRGSLQSPVAEPSWARRVLALQRVAGNAAVTGLLQTAVHPTAVHRRIEISNSPIPGYPRHEMTAAEREAFASTHFAQEREGAGEVLEDMAQSRDPMLYESEEELRSEVSRRLNTVEEMERSQTPVEGLTGFGYPYRGQAFPYGPRVNYAAREYWGPRVPDDYATRSRREARRYQTPDERAAHYGDPRDEYEFHLTNQGRAHPYEAMIRLFDPQPPHRRTLVHCDYVISLVHYRAFAESLGPAEFDRRVRGRTIPLVLRWDGFVQITEGGRTDLGALRRGGASLRAVEVRSQDDLVIGDHVVFYNHPAYDLLIARTGGVWRLENAILVERRDGEDIFLGHGSGRRTAAQMKEKLRDEFNDRVNEASEYIDRLRRIRRGTPQAAAALRQAEDRYPHLQATPNGEVFIVGDNPELGVTGIRLPLRRLTTGEIPGLRRPAHLRGPFIVRRPVESA